MRRRIGFLFFLAVCVGALLFVGSRLEIRPRSEASAENRQPRPAEASSEPAREIVPPEVRRIASRLETPGPNPAKGAGAFPPGMVLCQLRAANVRIPLGGKLKVWSYSYEIDEENQAGFVALIQSSECPGGLFSKVRIDHFGRVREELDCRTSRREEIFLQSGRQGEIKDVPSTAGKLNLAVSGAGYFVGLCPTGTMLFRRGDFRWDGRQTTAGACRILARDGNAFLWDGGPLSPEGCTEGGSCIALVEPQAESVRFVDRTSYLALGDPLRFPASAARIFNDSLEDLEDPQTGPTGPSWEEIPETEVPSDCPGDPA